MKNTRTTFGVDGFQPARPDKGIVAAAVEVGPGLGSDREKIPANGTTFATLNYAGPEPSPHAWTVNGVLSSEVALLDAASGLMVSELNVTMAQAGPIEVSVNGSVPLTLQAT